jgi:hypothetical protein
MKLVILVAAAAVVAQPPPNGCPAPRETAWHLAVLSYIQCLDAPREVSRQRPKRYCEDKAIRPLIERGCSERRARAGMMARYRVILGLLLQTEAR